MSEAQVVSKRGVQYRILKTSEIDEYEAATAAPLAAPARALAAGDNFDGTAGKAAKLSVVDADPEQFADLRQLLESLAPDDDMVEHDPEITEDAGSDRVEEEQRNVKVRAFLYAASRESDNDFHFIVGRDPGKSPLMCMTMELSGLPPHNSAAFARLKAARDAYKAFIGPDLPGAGYHHYDPPIPIEVEGSLFFDITHAHGAHPGPGKLRPFIHTIWEVHPISRIVFEP